MSFVVCPSGISIEIFEPGFGFRNGVKFFGLFVGAPQKSDAPGAMQYSVCVFERLALEVGHSKRLALEIDSPAIRAACQTYVVVDWV